MRIVDLFASEYGWTRNEIFDHVYLDEYFYLLDVIRERNRRENLLKVQFHMIPQMSEEGIKEFLRLLKGDDFSDIPAKTDFKALERAKQQLKMKQF